MSRLILLLLGIVNVHLIYAGILENKNKEIRQLGNIPLIGNVPGQILNIPDIIPGPVGAPLLNLGGLAPQVNGGPLLKLDPFAVQVPGVAGICVNAIGQPLIGSLTPGCTTLAPGVTVQSNRPGPPGPATSPPGAATSPPGAATFPPGVATFPPGVFTPGTNGSIPNIVDQIAKLIQSLLGSSTTAKPPQLPTVKFTPIPPSNLVQGIPGLSTNNIPNLPQNQLPQNQLPQNQLPQNQLPQNQLPQNQLPQNPFIANFTFPFAPISSVFGIPGGLQFGPGISGFINIGVPGLPGYINIGLPGLLDQTGGLGQCGLKGTPRSLAAVSSNNFNEYCWQASIFSRGNYKCSATIITSKYLITTAFCLIGRMESELNVRVGESWINSSVGINGQYLGVDKISIHQDYNPTSGRYENNIAIIKLAKAIQNTPTVCAICLPGQSETTPTDGSQFNNRKCTITGFGSSSVAGGENSKQLKVITVPIIPNQICSRVLMRTVLNFQPHPSFLCAGGVKGEDACTGDGGGALVCPNSDGVTYTLAGIASWGAGCGKNGIPAVYSNIVALTEFITRIISQ